MADGAQSDGAGVVMRVLVACERSGVFRRAFRDRGHDAWSLDLEPADDGDPHHIVGDALEHLDDGWDILIAHPACTRLSLSGVRWLHERGLWSDLDAACRFFRAFLDAKVPRIAVENPQMHGHALRRVGVLPTQAVQPWWFGDPVTKRTCWWLRGLPPLMATAPRLTREPTIHRMAPGPERARLRSRSFPGMAAAAADQWGVVR